MTSLDLVKLAETLQPAVMTPGWSLGKKIVDPYWLATVSDPMDLGSGVVVPGHQQMDDMQLDKGEYVDLKKHPPSKLPERGYRAPKLYGIPSAVPAGHYNVGHAANAAWRHHMAGRPMPSAYGMPALEGALSLTSTPIPRLGAVGEMQMAQVLNSWRRSAMRTNPAMARAFKMYSNLRNVNLLTTIGKALTKVR